MEIFHLSPLFEVWLMKNHNGLDNGLAPNRRQAIIQTNGDPVQPRIYAALREEE